MPTPTNPYYQRVFSAVSGTLARARSVLSEFVLIQRGFDLIGQVENVTKYQLSCSDLVTSLQANGQAGYFRAQRAFVALDVRASLLSASSGGNVVVSVTVNGQPMLSTNITIEQGQVSSTTAAVQPALAITEIPDDALFVVSIDSPGTGAKGLIVAVTGRISTALG